MDKLLNHHLSAKYWLHNHLQAENVIVDPFYDVGYAGGNLDTITTFPTLADLQSRAVDKKREVILVDASQDPGLVVIAQYLSEAIQEKSLCHQLKIISHVVCKVMGSTESDPSRISDHGHRFRIAELKLKYNSNVIPIGAINLGTFYHRALLFKVLCDRLGVCQNALVRGEYDRAWNVVDLDHQIPAVATIPAVVPQSLPSTQFSQSTSIPSTTPLPKQSPVVTKDKSTTAVKSKQGDGSGARVSTTQPSIAVVSTALPNLPTTPTPQTEVSNSVSNDSISASTIEISTAAIEAILGSIVLPDDDTDVKVDGVVVIDLIYEPGKLMKADDVDTQAYQRIS
ncbi:hypothetical protein BDEG_24744 [Batrachochytrium dendrobatidis JEL423]|uniref:EDR1/CTR1/ARMC3-like peptidase-like domain-containing protein n=1 Tax=Batrachochytrium dendrobatidis (strain JEL423) TaxID=403673 RepID=A0A177WLV5_BATDL|nr:hypothetical protein BDEG_24744 [Batrachochytrium dendrobatidis JEL423]